MEWGFLLPSSSKEQKRKTLTETRGIRVFQKRKTLKEKKKKKENPNRNQRHQGFLEKENPKRRKKRKTLTETKGFRSCFLTVAVKEKEKENTKTLKEAGDMWLDPWYQGLFTCDILGRSCGSLRMQRDAAWRVQKISSSSQSSWELPRRGSSSCCRARSELYPSPCPNSSSNGRAQIPNQHFFNAELCNNQINTK